MHLPGTYGSGGVQRWHPQRSGEVLSLGRRTLLQAEYLPQVCRGVFLNIRARLVQAVSCVQKGKQSKQVKLPENSLRSSGSIYQFGEAFLDDYVERICQKNGST